MELSDLFPISKELPITMPDGSPTDVVLKVVGHDSKRFREVAKKYAQQLMGDDKPSVELLEKQNAELVAACIVGWSGLTKEGVVLDYSEDEAMSLMLKPELTFIREQVERFVAQRANFFRGRPQAA